MSGSGFTFSQDFIQEFGDGEPSEDSQLNLTNGTQESSPILSGNTPLRTQAAPKQHRGTYL